MKVFIVMLEIPYEGESLVSIHATEEGAKQAADKENGDGGRYGYCRVHEMEVEK